MVFWAAFLWSFGLLAPITVFYGLLPVLGYGFLDGIMVFWGWCRGLFLNLRSVRLLAAGIYENYGLIRGFVVLNSKRTDE